MAWKKTVVIEGEKRAGVVRKRVAVDDGSPCYDMRVMTADDCFVQQ